MLIPFLLGGIVACLVMLAVLASGLLDDPVDDEAEVKARVQRHRIKRARDLSELRYAVRLDAQRLRREMEEEFQEAD